MSRSEITIHLESFEGPLDLLLYLIQSNELDISKISVTKVTDQYLAYIKYYLQELNFDLASEFLVMAATLLYWKSKALLPKEEQDAMEDEGEQILTQEELVRQILEHKRFLQTGEDLAQIPQLGIEVFTRHNQKPPTEKIWREMNLSDLTISYQDCLIRDRRRMQIVKKETVSLSQKIQEFAKALPVGKMVELKKLIQDITSRPETVVTFLASLELSRLKKLKIYQQGTYDPIFLELIEAFQKLDFEFKSEFDIQGAHSS